MIVVRWLIACAVIFGGLAWATRVVRRMVPAGGGGRGPLARLGAVALGPRRALVVVKVGDDIHGFLFHEHGVLDLGPVAGWPAEVTPAPATPASSWLAVALGPKASEWTALARAKLGRAAASEAVSELSDAGPSAGQIPMTRDFPEDLPPYGPDHPDWQARQMVLGRADGPVAAASGTERPRAGRQPSTTPEAVPKTVGQTRRSSPRSAAGE